MALPQLTQNQLNKLLRRPNWLDANTAIAGRVFASNEGWMLSPTKIHPDPMKQMPAECVMAIPNLSEYIEYNQSGVTPTEYATEQASPGKLLFRSVSVTRRSRSRYIVNIAMDETLNVITGQIDFGFNQTQVYGAMTTSPGLLTPSSAVLTTTDFSVLEGNSFGRIQMDLTFDQPVDEVKISSTTWSNLITVSLPSSIVDQEGNPITDFDIDDAMGNIPVSDRWDGTTLTVVP